MRPYSYYFFPDCDIYTYGEGCYGICGHCHYNQTCNPVNGVCENGCDPGYYVETENPKCTKGKRTIR